MTDLAEVEQLRDEIWEYKKLAEAASGLIHSLGVEIEAWEKRVASLQEALVKYGQHPWTCSKPCTCGLDEVLAGTEGKSDDRG